MFWHFYLLFFIIGTKCPAGQYSDASDMTQCKSCSAGKWSNQPGLTADSECTSCIAGRYSNLDARTKPEDCILCPSDQYTDQAGLQLARHVPVTLPFQVQTQRIMTTLLIAKLIVP